MLWTNTLVWKTHCLANVAMKGDISSKEILRIGMLRISFSCGCYQQHIFCETKIILSCLFLLEAHGLEYLYYRPILIKYHDNTCSGKWGNIAGYTNNSLFAQHRTHCCDIVRWIIMNSYVVKKNLSSIGFHMVASDILHLTIKEWEAAVSSLINRIL